MLEYRARVQQQLVEQESEGLHRFIPGREQVLGRLWELAILGPEITRGSITGQVKAISMIVAIEGLIPDRRAGSAQRDPDPPPTKAQIHTPPWRRRQQEEAAGLQPDPDRVQEDQEEEGLSAPQAELALGSAEDAPPDPALSLAPASPPSPLPLASRKPNRRLMPLLLPTPGFPSLSKETLPGAASEETETHALAECAKTLQKDRILSNFIKNQDTNHPHARVQSRRDWIPGCAAPVPRSK